MTTAVSTSVHELISLIRFAIVPAVRRQVRATNADTGAETQVNVRLVPQRIENLLNLPTLCCIFDIRLRLNLSRILLNALEFYEEGKFKKAIGVLCVFLDRASAVDCELSPEVCALSLSLQRQMVKMLANIGPEVKMLTNIGPECPPVRALRSRRKHAWEWPSSTPPTRSV